MLNNYKTYKKIKTYLGKHTSSRIQLLIDKRILNYIYCILYRVYQKKTQKFMFLKTLPHYTTNVCIDQVLKLQILISHHLIQVKLDTAHRKGSPCASWSRLLLKRDQFALQIPINHIQPSGKMVKHGSRAYVSSMLLLNCIQSQSLLHSSAWCTIL